MEVNAAFEEMTWHGKPGNTNVFKVETVKMIGNGHEVESAVCTPWSPAGRNQVGQRSSCAGTRTQY